MATNPKGIGNMGESKADGGCRIDPGHNNTRIAEAVEPAPPEA